MAGLSAKRLTAGTAIAIALVLACLDLAHAVKHRPSHVTAVRPPAVTGCARRGPRVLAHGPAARRRLALTFDDGPKRFTEPILRELDGLHARATFFEEGRHVAGHRRVMRQILRSGDEIGNHSTRHHAYPGAADLARTDRLIHRATGFEPCLFRPPYGLLNSHVIAAAAGNGLQIILWSVDSLDDREPGVRVIDRTVVDEAHPGAIVLLHDGGADRRQTVAAVPRIVRSLRGRGYRLMTVSGLLGEHMRRRQASAPTAGATIGFPRISPSL